MIVQWEQWEVEAYGCLVCTLLFSMCNEALSTFFSNGKERGGPRVKFFGPEQAWMKIKDNACDVPLAPTV